MQKKDTKKEDVKKQLDEIKNQLPAIDEKTLCSEIGARVAKLREAKKWRQEDVAYLLDMSRSTYAGKETNERNKTFSIFEILKLSLIFQVSLLWLIAGVTSENKDIHEETGLSNAAIEALRGFKKDVFSRGYGDFALYGVSKALSSKNFLYLLASFMTIDSHERGYDYILLERRNKDYYNVDLSPDSYASLVQYRLIHVLEALRTGEFEELPHYPPSVERWQKQIQQKELVEQLQESAEIDASKQEG